MTGWAGAKTVALTQTNGAFNGSATSVTLAGTGPAGPHLERRQRQPDDGSITASVSGLAPTAQVNVAR